MKIFLTLLLIVLSPTSSFAAEKESAFDRITRTGTIRCAYWLAPPMLMKDPNTGAMSGAFVDFVEALGKALDLKIEWAGEINLSTYLQDLNQGKFDAECGTGWPSALRGKQAEYTKPIGYMPTYVYVKAGNAKLKNISSLNNAEVRFSGHDGGTNTLMKEKIFPKATLVGITGDAPASEALNMIKFAKADATISGVFEGDNYSKANPDTISRIVSEPLRVIPISLTVASGEFRLLNMLNTATDELLYDGTVDRIYDKYSIAKDVILRPAKPY